MFEKKFEEQKREREVQFKERVEQKMKTEQFQDSFIQTFGDVIVLVISEQKSFDFLFTKIVFLVSFQTA